MGLLEIPRKLFGNKIHGEGKVKAFFSNFMDNIVEVEMYRKEDPHNGYILGLKDQNILIRTLSPIEEKKIYEFRFLSEKGIVLFRSSINGKIENTTPPIYMAKLPSEVLICERRRFHRVKVPSKSEVIIKRENGYAFYCSLSDISLGGFSANMQIKDKMIEYFLPMIDEEVKFSLRIDERRRKIDIDGKARLKHYSIDAQGKYKAGFSFTKVDRKKIKEISKLVGNTAKSRKK